MATKFSEILLAVRYREVTPEGNVVGGAMYVIKHGLGPRWMWLGTTFAVFGALAGFGIGNTVQANSIADALNATFSIKPEITALGLLILVGAVLLSGLKRIGAVAGKVVPLMALLYITVSLVVLALNFGQLPDVLMLVVREAFTESAAAGGFAGARVWMAIRYIYI